MSEIQLKTESKPPAIAQRRPFLSPLNMRRWENFKANRRGWWSLWLFLVLFVLSMFSEFIANDKPVIASYKGEILFPVLVDYPEKSSAGSWPLPTIATRSFRTRSRRTAGWSGR